MPQGLNKIVYERWNKAKDAYVCATEEMNGVMVWLQKPPGDNVQQSFYIDKMAGIEAATELAKKYA